MNDRQRGVAARPVHSDAHKTSGPALQTPRWLSPAGYLVACVFLAAAAWVATGTVDASDPAPTPAHTVARTATPRPTATPTLTPGPTDTIDPTDPPSPSPDPTVGDTPYQAAAPFQIDVYKANSFVSQTTKDECTAGATQIMLNVISGRPDLSADRQLLISNTIIANTDKQDSHDGGYGPVGWALTMKQMGGGNYKVISDGSLADAMHDAAVALRRTGRPVGLLAWKGAHSWVMTGFRSNKDPRKTSTFNVYGAFISDPYYPRHSSIWGQTMGPDTYRNWAEMAGNFVPWHRTKEGIYPGREGRWLLVVPY